MKLELLSKPGSKHPGTCHLNACKRRDIIPSTGMKHDCKCELLSISLDENQISQVQPDTESYMCDISMEWTCPHETVSTMTPTSCIALSVFCTFCPLQAAARLWVGGAGGTNAEVIWWQAPLFTFALSLKVWTRNQPCPARLATTSFLELISQYTLHWKRQVSTFSKLLWPCCGFWHTGERIMQSCEEKVAKCQDGRTWKGNIRRANLDDEESQKYSCDLGVNYSDICCSGAISSCFLFRTQSQSFLSTWHK